MKNWPTDPMRQHDRMIAALCDDMLAGHFTLTGPAVTRVCEINRQVNHGEAGSAQEAPARNHNGK